MPDPGKGLPALAPWPWRCRRQWERRRTSPSSRPDFSWSRRARSRAGSPTPVAPSGPGRRPRCGWAWFPALFAVVFVVAVGETRSRTVRRGLLGLATPALLLNLAGTVTVANLTPAGWRALLTFSVTLGGGHLRAIERLPHLAARARRSHRCRASAGEGEARSSGPGTLRACPVIVLAFAEWPRGHARGGRRTAAALCPRSVGLLGD